ncbi:MAG TPA: FtsX-like permease family protein, partial [Thermoanaerobaculia bacterium]|nr:FtsX-like permease family protein [Thermoanaerobaculia bacterium]
HGGRSAVDARRAPVREALVVSQLALATMLVVAAALLGQSYLRLQDVALGFQPDRLVTARISFPDWGDDESHEEDHVLMNALLGEVRALPGVVSAGMASEIPLGDVDTTMAAAAQRIAPGGKEGVQASWRSVTPDYLAALGVPLRRGRWFQESGEHHRSVLLSEALARRVWPDGTDPVGRQVWLSNGQAYNVVGMVGDARQLGLAQEVTPTIYMSSTWAILPTMNLVVRTAGDPDALAGALREVTARISPDRPFFDVRTMSAVIARSVAAPRLQTLLVALFAGLALLLAAVGVGGVVAYGVVQRTPELAVRAALGASPRRILRHVLRRGVVLCGAGVALGLLLAFALGSGLQDLLYGVRAQAPAAYAATALVLLAVGTLACWLPARRATRINPNLALRAE